VGESRGSGAGGADLGVKRRYTQVKAPHTHTHNWVLQTHQKRASNTQRAVL
jgi:hypothetical protein